MPPLNQSDSVSEFALAPNQSYTSESARENTKKFESFDFLRATCSVIVVALKSNLFMATEVLSSTVAYVLISQVAYLAVPVFIQISLFLFYLKTCKGGVLQYFFRKRLPKLIYLYLFWVGLKILADLISGSPGIESAFSSPRAFLEFIVSGSNSPFFFFFSLIFLSTLAAFLSGFFNLIEQRAKVIALKYLLLFLTSAFIFVLSMAEAIVTQLSGQPVSGMVSSIASLVAWDYNPISFLPYLFTTAIVAQEVAEKRLTTWSSSMKLKAYILFSLYILFSILEWHFLREKLHYSRLSLVFGSWLLLYWAVLSPRKAPAFIHLLATCSLGIYGFHVFFTEYFSPGVTPALESFFQSRPLVEAFATFLLALFGSIGLTLIFKRVRGLKSFV